MGQEVSLGIVFSAGLLSFLSPCVLPLIPGYIAFVSGVSIDELTGSRGEGLKLASAMLNSFLFVVGFSVVFITLGASATWLGGFLVERLPLLTDLAGLVIITIGLHQLSVFKFGFLLTTKQVDLPSNRLGVFKAPMLGAAFAFGWTPCIGPILAAVLTYAATLDTVNKGVMYLAVYSAGLGIPFLLTTMAMGGFFKLFSKVKRFMPFVEKISGGILVLLGVLMITGKLNWITSQLGFLNSFAK